ncbi:MAG TPA: PadR family transcriptional regulator [Dehalococcoidia bacterium]|jgi:DNA-binding PadR family transcriptional regulator|nr:PadR family transcriptional regulator [Dehalococcoidia bacterium]
MKYPLLALLATGAAHGYELKQSFESRFGAVWPPVNIGQIYTTLQRLERDGLVHGYEVEQAGRPDKHVFEITEAGLHVLGEWVHSAAAAPRVRDEFFMKLMLARLARLADPMELIDRQRLAFFQELRDLNDLSRDEKTPNSTTQLLIEGAALHVEADLKWLDLCEDRLRKDEEL